MPIKTYFHRTPAMNSIEKYIGSEDGVSEKVTENGYEKQEWNEDGALKVLCIGNSFSRVIELLKEDLTVRRLVILIIAESTYKHFNSFVCGYRLAFFEFSVAIAVYYTEVVELFNGIIATAHTHK